MRRWPTNTSSWAYRHLGASTGSWRRKGCTTSTWAEADKLVEVIGTVVIYDGAVDDVAALAERLGKTPVWWRRAGFIANSLLFGYLYDAARGGVARRQPRGHHAAMTWAAGHRWVSLALMDLIGLDAHQGAGTGPTTRAGTAARAAPGDQADGHRRSLGRKSGRGSRPYQAQGVLQDGVLDATTPLRVP